MGLATQHIGKLIDGLRFWLIKPPTREMIHEIRLHIKRIRALWLIHPIANSISFHYSFPGLSKLFKKAGNYRDLQNTLLCLETLPGWNDKDKAGVTLMGKIKVAKAKIKKPLHKSYIEQTVFHELHRLYTYYKMASGFLLRSTRKHYRAETVRLLVSIDGTKDEELHDLRKRIKNSLYQFEAFPLKNNYIQPAPSNQELQNLQAQLGKWHDWWFVTEYLKQLKKVHVKPSLKGLLEQAEKKTALLKRDAMCNLIKISPKMASITVTTMGDEKVIQIPAPRQKTAKLHHHS